MRNINLIRTKTTIPPELEVLALWLGRISTFTLIGLIITGVITGGIFFYVQLRVNTLTDRKDALIQQVTQETTKEGLLLATKSRSGIVDKLLQTKKPLEQILDTVTRFVSKEQLIALTYDDTGRTVIRAHASSLDEVVVMVDGLVKEVTAKRLRQAQLVSLMFESSGGMQVSFSFTTIL